MSLARSVNQTSVTPVNGRRLPGARIKTWLKKVSRKYNVFDRRSEKEILFDVVGSCNLRCPSCPVGHAGQINPTGLIDKTLVAKLIAKADREYKITGVYLFNWAEPLLHPELPELIQIVKSRGLRCYLSSNLNILRDTIDDILLAGPDVLRISLSGFTQDVYSKTHAGGNVERVKENMRKLSEARQRTGARTKIRVYYHKYKNNLHEVDLMHAYASSLGFDWSECWAYYMGTEKLIDFMESGPEAREAEFFNNEFALPIRDCLEATTPYRNERCTLLDKQLVFDLQGNLLPCCTVYDYKRNSIGNFLNMSPADVEHAKKKASICASCASHGIHVYAVYGEHPQLRETYDQLARTHVDASLVQLSTRLPAA